jgi:hypothetical protein
MGGVLLAAGRTCRPFPTLVGRMLPPAAGSWQHAAHPPNAFLLCPELHICHMCDTSPVRVHGPVLPWGQVQPLSLELRSLSFSLCFSLLGCRRLGNCPCSCIRFPEVAAGHVCFNNNLVEHGLQRCRLLITNFNPLRKTSGHLQRNVLGAPFRQ